MRSLECSIDWPRKLHLVDSGLAAHMLRLSPAKLAQLDPTSLTEFGNLLETFVAGELAKQASWRVSGSVPPTQIWDTKSRSNSSPRVATSA
jgi:predicted AAA+ superfamily ATPase